MNKLMKILLISLSSILLVGIIAAVIVIYVLNGDDAEKERSIDDMNSLSYETPEVTTDLKDGTFVRIQFKLIADDKAGLKELEKREFQIKNTMIKQLSILTEEDMKSGITELEKNVKDGINEVMTDGVVTDVYTVSKILQ